MYEARRNVGCSARPIVGPNTRSTARGFALCHTGSSQQKRSYACYESVAPVSTIWPSTYAPLKPVSSAPFDHCRKTAAALTIGDGLAGDVRDGGVPCGDAAAPGRHRDRRRRRGRPATATAADGPRGREHGRDPRCARVRVLPHHRTLRPPTSISLASTESKTGETHARPALCLGGLQTGRERRRRDVAVGRVRRRGGLSDDNLVQRDAVLGELEDGRVRPRVGRGGEETVAGGVLGGALCRDV